MSLRVSPRRCLRFPQQSHPCFLGGFGTGRSPALWVHSSPASDLLSPFQGKDLCVEGTGLRRCTGLPEKCTVPLIDRPLFLCSGLKEANDIVLYLKPLRILLEEMEQADFTMV